jgi:hypothetical protein
MDKKNIEKLGKWGLHPRFQYTRYDDRSVTAVCFVENSKKQIIAEGYAFCSKLDAFIKSEARDKALGRAIGAIEHGRNSYPINKSKSSRALRKFDKGYRAILNQPLTSSFWSLEYQIKIV